MLFGEEDKREDDKSVIHKLKLVRKIEEKITRVLSPKVKAITL